MSSYFQLKLTTEVAPPPPPPPPAPAPTPAPPYKPEPIRVRRRKRRTFKFVASWALKRNAEQVFASGYRLRRSVPATTFAATTHLHRHAELTFEASRLPATRLATILREDDEIVLLLDL